MLENADGAIKMDNPEKPATLVTQDTKTKSLHNMCWTQLYTNKHK